MVLQWTANSEAHLKSYLTQVNLYLEDLCILLFVTHLVTRSSFGMVLQWTANPEAHLKSYLTQVNLFLEDLCILLFVTHLVRMSSFGMILQWTLWTPNFVCANKNYFFINIKKKKNKIKE